MLQRLSPSLTYKSPIVLSVISMLTPILLDITQFCYLGDHGCFLLKVQDFRIHAAVIPEEVLDDLNRHRIYHSACRRTGPNSCHFSST